MTPSELRTTMTVVRAFRRARAAGDHNTEGQTWAPTKTCWLWAALVFPSLYIVNKYLGWEGALAYAVAAAAGVALAPRVTQPRTDRAAAWGAVATLFLVALAFVMLYPRVNVQTPGLGSDDDDAYNVGARALATGHSPYEQTTYLGNALHQLPGAFVVALPFVLAGTSALQNLVWLPLFFLAVKAETGNGRAALRLAWLVLALAPTVLHQVVTGTGHAANTIYVLLGVWWLVRTRHLGLAAAAWGIGLASRPNFFFLLPLAFGWIRQARGLGAAFRATALTCATSAALTLPYYLHDPSHFGPLDAADRVLRFNTVVPYGGELIVALMGALAIGLSFTRMNTGALFRNCALVQAFPVAAGAVLGVWQSGRVDLAYVAYSTFASWFALMAWAGEQHQEGADRRCQ